MGNVLLTLFYHPDEHHATHVCDIFEKESPQGAVTYRHSASDGHSPDLYLNQRAIEYGCTHILTIHSDNLGMPPFCAYIFSDKIEQYRQVFEHLQQKFGGAYGFDEPHVEPTQIDIELSEDNKPEDSVLIIKELVELLSTL